MKIRIKPILVRVIFMSVLVAFFGAGNANAGSQQKFGKWLYTTKSDEMTDQVVKAAMVPNFEDDLDTKMLIVECAAGQLTIFLLTERFINLKNAPTKIAYRFDEHPPIQETWQVTPNNPVAISNGDIRSAARLVKSLSEGKGKLKFRYEDADGTDHNVSFPLSGSTAALKNVISHCPSAFLGTE